MKYIVTFKNPRLEPLVVDKEVAGNAVKAMAHNGLWEHKGKFINGTAIDAVSPMEQEKLPQLPVVATKPVSQEMLKKTAKDLRKRGFEISGKY